jgi:hypothetical protein
MVQLGKDDGNAKKTNDIPDLQLGFVVVAGDASRENAMN